MKVIVLRPYDDHDIVEVLLAEHAVHPNKNFEKDYDQALEKAKKDSPDEWQINDVFTILEKKNWKILIPSHITLTY